MPRRGAGNAYGLDDLSELVRGEGRLYPSALSVADNPSLPTAIVQYVQYNAGYLAMNRELRIFAE